MKDLVMLKYFFGLEVSWTWHKWHFLESTKTYSQHYIYNRSFGGQACRNTYGAKASSIFAPKCRIKGPKILSSFGLVGRLIYLTITHPSWAMLSKSWHNLIEIKSTEARYAVILQVIDRDLVISSRGMYESLTTPTTIV